MSHLSILAKANIIDKPAFIEGCKELGYTKITENTTIIAHDGKTMRVDVAVTNGKYSVGLVKNVSGKYDLVGDFQCFGWELPSAIKTALKMTGSYVSDTEIQNCILRYTTKHTLTNQYKKLGYNCKANEDKAGNIQVTMTKF